MQAETYTRQGTGAPASNNLTPDTTYEISVAAGNDHDFGEEILVKRVGIQPKQTVEVFGVQQMSYKDIKSIGLFLLVQVITRKRA